MQWLLSCYTQRVVLSGLQSNRRSQNRFLHLLNFTTYRLTRQGGLLLLSFAQKIFLIPLGVEKNPHRSYRSRSCKFKWLQGHAGRDSEENKLVMTHPEKHLMQVLLNSCLAWFSWRNEESPMSTQLQFREKRKTLMCVISWCVPLHTHARRGGSD